MFTSKQRSNLKSLAMNIEPIAQVGKSGVGEAFLDGVDKALSARELIKIAVLQNASDDPDEIAARIAEALGAEVVCVIGKKIVLYRRSDKKGVEHIVY